MKIKRAICHTSMSSERTDEEELEAMYRYYRWRLGDFAPQRIVLEACVAHCKASQLEKLNVRVLTLARAKLVEVQATRAKRKEKTE